MKMMKKIMAFICAVLLTLPVLGFFNRENVQASNGTLTITPSATSVISGKEITVTVKLDYLDQDENGNIGINVCMYDFRYDSDKFEYVGGDAPGSGYDGVITLNFMEMDMPTSLTWTFKFKAKNIGSSSFSITNGTFINGNLDEFNPVGSGVSSAEVKVMAVGSDDATLNALQIVGVNLSPAFNKATTSYTAYVPNSVTAVKLGATSTQGGKVEITGNYGNLVVGKNVITITSYAPNGATLKYTVNIVRLEPPTEPPTAPPTEPPTEPIKDVGIEINGEKYTINSSYKPDIIPSGFVADVDTYNGKEVLVAVNNQLGVKLMYLMNEEKVGAFYVYDESDNSFCRFVRIDTGVRKYILLNGENQTNKPAGCELKEIEAAGTRFDAYISEDNPEFAYFYALSSEGTKNWYCLDVTENTIQRMNVASFEQETTDEETQAPTEPIVTVEDTQSDVISSLQDANNQLKDDYAHLKKVQFMVYVIGGMLIAIMIIFIIVILCNKSAKKNEEEPDLAELADDEDADENIDSDVDEVAATDEVNEGASDVEEEENVEPSIDSETDTELAEEIGITREEQEAFDKEATAEPIEASVMGALAADIRSMMDSEEFKTSDVSEPGVVAPMEAAESETENETATDGEAPADDVSSADDEGDGIEIIDASNFEDETFF